MSRDSQETTGMLIRLGRQGRVVLPAAVRRKLELQTGDRLLVHLEADGRVVLERPEDVRKRLQKRFQKIPSATSLSRELIAERRREGEREDG